MRAVRPSPQQPHDVRCAACVQVAWCRKVAFTQARGGDVQAMAARAQTAGLRDQHPRVRSVPQVQWQKEWRRQK